MKLILMGTILISYGTCVCFEKFSFKTPAENGFFEACPATFAFVAAAISVM